MILAVRCVLGSLLGGGPSALVFSLTGGLIAMGVMGVKIFTHNYDIVAECYAAMGCWAVFLLCVLLRALQSKCPHCGRLRVSKGAYCPFCGKEMKE